ncbi:MAG: DMT family transporter [Hungatella sp.]
MITNKTKAIIFMILSACSFSVMQLGVKLSGGTIPMMEQVFVRNFFTMFFGYCMAISAGIKNPFGKRKNQKALMLRSLLGYLGIVMYFYASRNMLIADATLLHRSSPFFVVIFSCLFLKERLSKVHIGVLTAAALGALCVIQPQFNSDMFPAMIGLLSAVSAGAAYTVISYLKGKEHNGVIIFYFSAVSCLISLPFMLMDFVLPNGYELLMLLMIGIFASLGQIFLTIAYKNAPAGEVSIYNFSGIICSCLLGYFLLHEILDFMSILGIVMIMTAALVMFLYDKKLRVVKGKQ